LAGRCESAKHHSCYTHGCPCGYFGNPVWECTCSGQTISRCQIRISGPLLDRIDIHIEVPRIDYEKLSERRAGWIAHQGRRRPVRVARDGRGNRLYSARPGYRAGRSRARR
jgi:magnesium chelatase family protein